MEDNNIKWLKYFKIIIIVLVVFIVSIVGYLFIMKKINTENFHNYLSKNEYKKKDGIYQKKINDGNETLRYKALSEEFIISKEIAREEDDGYFDLSLQYEKNGNIKIGFQLEGFNKNNAYGILYQNGNYNDGKFDCKVVSGEGYDARCGIMKKEAIKFDKEVKKLFEENGIRAKFIKN